MKIINKIFYTFIFVTFSKPGVYFIHETYFNLHEPHLKCIKITCDLVATALNRSQYNALNPAFFGCWL